MAMNGNSLGPDEQTGFLEPKKNYSIEGFTADRKKVWLERYRETGNLTKTCDEIGIAPQTFYNALDTDREFKRAFWLEKVRAQDDLEASMLERGKKGSFIHAIAWLRGNFPAKWGQKSQIVHTKDDSSASSILDAAHGEVLEAEIIPPGPSEGQG